MNLLRLRPDQLRGQIVGVDTTFDTPFGRRLMVYCDYTASGRCLGFVERYLMRLQRHYANTHTEDDVTGRSMTRLLHQAEQIIKQAVNAGPAGRVICTGTGSTGAIDKFQQLVGVGLPAATRQMLTTLATQFLEPHAVGDLEDFLARRRPVVFVGPYEHHSNEVSWRESLATVVEVRLAEDGGVDLGHLQHLLQLPDYSDRLRIGSFSAASNVTGMRSPVHEIAALLHRFDCLACFDYAASAPYVDIDMNPAPDRHGGDRSLDAIFVSPHKFLGGPGSSGVLVFNDHIYHHELPPSVAGGGTVDYVSMDGHAFISNVEEREKAGTPGVLQTMKAALAFEVKRAVGVPHIEARDQDLLQRALACWLPNSGIDILGNPDPERRIPIVSFNLRDPSGAYLHPKLVTMLLNDLFGIQSRAGCSCAGPYGHRLLGIDSDTSSRFRQWITRGYQGIKPGWCRLGFHYAMDDDEAGYVIEAVDLLGRYGYRFARLYAFDLMSGGWAHRDFEPSEEAFSLQTALEDTQPEPAPLTSRKRAALYRRYLDHAERLAETLGEPNAERSRRLDGELGELQFFVLDG